MGKKSAAFVAVSLFTIGLLLNCVSLVLMISAMRTETSYESGLRFLIASFVCYAGVVALSYQRRHATQGTREMN